MAWRAAVAAFRLAPDEPSYRADAVRRTLLRSNYLQLTRSVSNFLLYAGLVLFGAGRRFAPLLILMVPLALPLLIPGVIGHLLTNALAAALSPVLGARIRRRLLGQPEDESLIEDLRTAASHATSESD
jgi:hypothetical protein